VNRRFLALCLGSSLALIGCQHPYLDTKSGTIEVDAKLTITQSSEGAFEFRYQAPFADAGGNFDFSKGEPLGKIVNLSFTIADDSGVGLKFKPEGRDAIWIVDKKNVGPDGSPEGPYRGTQFQDFAVSPDGKTLTLVDLNNDGVRYQYGLRFDLGDKTVVDDPEVNNGHGSGGGN
jgi:hypothetical protein